MPGADDERQAAITAAEAEVTRALDTLATQTGAMEPCYRCGCCRRWTTSLELLRAHAHRHRAMEPPRALTPCAPGCLICAEVDW